MKKDGRYDTSGYPEDQSEPGSRGRVLKNLLGVTRKREIDEIEAREHIRALHEFLASYDIDHQFTADDICFMHKNWLGSVYEWAGKYRQVNIGKDGFFFAAAKHIPQLMAELEKKQLRKFTPCVFQSEAQVVKALAVVHTELVLIHPFREGNGRLARMVATLMALQAGLPPLDFKNVQGDKRQEYFFAVQSGMDMNYDPMAKIFSEVLKQTLNSAKKG